MTTGTTRGSHLWPLVIGIVISLICLGAALGSMLRDKQALAQIGTAFATANYVTLLPYWIALAALYVIKAWRWRLFLRPVGDYHTTRDLLPPVMTGFAFNNVLPAHLGDFVRVFVFARQQRVSPPAVLSSVVLERVFDIIAVLILLGGGLLFVPQLDPGVHRTAMVFAAISAVFLLGAVVFVIWTKPFVAVFEWFLGRVPLIPAGLRAKLTGMLEAGASGLASLKQPRLLAGIFGSSLLQWLLNALLVHLSLWSFGLHFSPAVSCLVVSVTAFGVTVPSSPGYFGVIQLCFMTVLQLFVDNQPAVFAASVYYHLAQYIPVTLVGMAYFVRSGMSLRDVNAAAETTPAEAASSSVTAS